MHWKTSHAGNHDLNKDYEATREIFLVYCELAPKFEDASFRKELDSLRDSLKRLVYYGAGAGWAAEERLRIDKAYEECMERMVSSGTGRLSVTKDQGTA